jgi:asparagine synthase (glutamine-hydrolysing)
MSGIVALLAANGAPVERELADRTLDRLDHRGPDGRHLLISGGIAVGHQHHWTTPEELGERQPVTSADGRFTLALDGRLDDREGFAGALGIDRAALGSLSDAELVLRAYQRWREGCFARLLGPFAVVVSDHLAHSLVCARDPLGDRPLFYGGDGRLSVAASEEQAVLAHPGLGSELDELGLAALYGVRARPTGRTYFASVQELPQGHLVRIDRDGAQVHRYWSWQPEQMHCRNDGEYAERYLELLSVAVRSRMRTPSAPGILMSGGLDSTSVACLAAREIDTERLHTVSWVFDELSSCDERHYMDAVTARWHTIPLRVNGDDGWPLRNAFNWPYNPNRPADNPYRILKERAFTAAREHGVGVLLTGGWGDHLYSFSRSWLVEQLRSSRWWSAGRELAWHAIHGSLFAEPGLRQLAPKLLRNHAKGLAAPPWMKPEAAQLLETHSRPPAGFQEMRRPDQAALVCGAQAADSAAGETFHASRHRLELRHPFRDRRLVEFMLAIPADQLSRRGMLKHVLRVAMAGVLPDTVRLRTRPTSLAALYQRGLVDRETDRMAELLSGPDALWRGFVREDQLFQEMPRIISEGRDGPAGLVPWYCAYSELWQRLGADNRATKLACA